MSAAEAAKITQMVTHDLKVGIAVSSFMFLVRMIHVSRFNSSRLVIVCILALIALFIESILALLVQYVDLKQNRHYLAYTIMVFQISTIALVDLTLYIRSKPFTLYRKVYLFLYSIDAGTRSGLIFLAYFFSLMRFTHPRHYNKEYNQWMRNVFDSSANIIGVVFDLIVSFVVIKHLRKAKNESKFQARGDFVKTVYHSSLWFMVLALMFDFVCTVILVAGPDDYSIKYMLNDVARALKSFSVPYVLLAAREDEIERTQKQFHKNESTYDTPKGGYDDDDLPSVDKFEV